MTHLNIFPTHRMSALSEKTGLEDLNRRGQLHSFQEEDPQQMLRSVYLTDAALAQYIIYDTASLTPLPFQFRLKNQSLSQLDAGVTVLMRWVVLDWDFEPKDIPWGDGNKPQTETEVMGFIQTHPILSKSYCWYFSKSGVRLIFRLKEPFQIIGEESVSVWKAGYSAFVKSCGKLLPKTKIELGARKNPFAFNRVPHYIDGETDTRQRRCFFLSDETITLPKVKVSARPPQPEVFYDKASSEEVKSLLWRDPFISALREHRPSLSYNDWRAVGTNIFALLGEEGESIFTEISSWDNSYDPASVSEAWSGIVQSGETYGPVRWSNFDIDFRVPYGDYPPGIHSSLAGIIYRQATKGGNQSRSAGISNPLPQNSREVYENLAFSVKEVKGETIRTPKKDLRNLEIIFSEDNRWKDQFTRNHLGSLDLFRGEQVQDEHITAMRRDIIESYGLPFSKDETWDMVRFLCYQQEFHPVFNYLQGLKWDGKDRFPMVSKVLGNGNDGFVDLLLKKWFISAVVRPLEWASLNPSVNWKVDTVLILKGGQGYKKSTFFETLVPDPSLFSDSLPCIQRERKDACIHMLGKWIIEQGEFEGHVARSSVENMKAFVSRKREDFRKPYGRGEVSMRRPSILVGTTNSDTFLNDPTGDRRFWVIEIPSSQRIDLAWTRDNRDQLWAQAKFLYESGEKWWLTSKEEGLNSKVNEAHRRLESYKELMDEYFATRPVLHALPPHEKFEGNIAFTMKNLTQFSLEKKLIEVVPTLLSKMSTYAANRGWRRIQVRLTGDDPRRMWCYRKLKNYVEDSDT